MPRAKTTRHALPPGRRTRRRPGRSVEEHPALQAIWDVVAQIPPGKVTTYGDVALAAGLPGRARQVGYALRHSPDDLPWFRVLGAGTAGRAEARAERASHAAGFGEGLPAA